MALKRHEYSDETTRLQEALLEAGYELPRYGVNGWLSDETMIALARFFAAHDRDLERGMSGVSDRDLATLYELCHSLRREVPPPVPADRFHDVRGLAGVRHDRGDRVWSRVTTVCLRQSGCVLGETPERWSHVGAHIGVTRGGQVMLLHDLNRLIFQDHGWGRESVGIELDGMYPGIEGDPSTFHRPAWDPDRQPQSPTPDLVEAAKAAIRWVKAIVESHGGRLRTLGAQRQASSERLSDPGSALWQQVALPLHAELSLTDGGVGFKLGAGFPIPRE